MRLKRRAALANCFFKQALRHRRCHQSAHRKGSCAFAKDGDIVRVAAKLRDIRIHPMQRGDHIQQAVIPRRAIALPGQLARRKKAEYPQPVIDGDEHHAFQGQKIAVMARF